MILGMADRGTAPRGHDIELPARSAAVDAHQGGGQQAAGEAAVQRILADRAPGWDGVDPVPPGHEVWVRRIEGYNHAGVYVGNGWVVHLDGSPAIHLGRILTHGHSWATVIRTSVAQYADGGHVHAGPTPTSRPVDAVIADALGWVGKTRNYNPLSDNCQHFSSMLVSGVATSLESTEIMLIAKQMLLRGPI